MNSRLDAALAYVARGWPVFPCRPGSKEPATSHGCHDATTDPDQVERMWRRHPEANVAIATGAPGPDVLDVDVAHGRDGHASLGRAMTAGLLPSPASVVATPSGGAHLYYLGTSQRNGSLPAHGLDFRSSGGYVVAPPSAVAGRAYAVTRQWRLTQGAVDFGAIRELLQPSAEVPIGRPRADWHHQPSRLAAWVAGQREGNRNQATFWAACRAAEAGDDSALAAIADAAVAAGLDRRAVDKTIASAVRTVAAQVGEAGREAVP